MIALSHPQSFMFLHSLLLWVNFAQKIIFRNICSPALFTTNLIYSGYNILTVNARNDILDGIVSIMVVSFFYFLGVYSQNLGFRFKHFHLYLIL